MCERQLDAGRRTDGDGQHGHGTQAGLGDSLATLQARPVHPLEQTVPQGEGRPPRGGKVTTEQNGANEIEQKGLLKAALQVRG